MFLANPFPIEVRKLYIDCWKCWICEENGSRKGGLEIHHIMGRISPAAFNSSVLCKECHSHMGHSQEEEQSLFFKTLKYLKGIGYQPNRADYDFLRRNYNRLVTPDMMEWLEI